MIKKWIALGLIIMMGLVGTGCQKEPEEKPQLLFYIGITMVKPIHELVTEFEEAYDCEIQIVQGGSQDLYDSLKQSGEGDLYLPGSYSYREKTLDEGLLLDAVFLGYNKAALMVKKGNPKGFTNDLTQLADMENRIVLCNPDSGSIGRESKKILDKFGNFDEVFSNSIYLTTDSRNLTDAIASGDADICINWYATSVWKENRDFVDAIEIDETYASKKMLIMSLLKSSKYPELSRAFLEFASSEHGRDVFKAYGFLDDADISAIDTVEFK